MSKTIDELSNMINDYLNTKQLFEQKLENIDKTQTLSLIDSLFDKLNPYYNLLTKLPDVNYKYKLLNFGTKQVKLISSRCCFRIDFANFEMNIWFEQNNEFSVSLIKNGDEFFLDKKFSFENSGFDVSQVAILHKTIKHLLNNFQIIETMFSEQIENTVKINLESLQVKANEFDIDLEK